MFSTTALFLNIHFMVCINWLDVDHYFTNTSQTCEIYLYMCVSHITLKHLHSSDIY